MPNLTQTIGPLIGGVSQAPPHMRPPEYATELLNALAHRALGTTKRPGSRHIAKLDDSSDGHYAAASLFPFNASDKRRYVLSVSNGELRVVEADTGISRTVVMAPGAAAYLSGTLDDEQPFAAAATGDTLYLANRARVVAMMPGFAPERPAEAVIAIRAADYGTNYTVTLNGTSATYTTPDGTSATVRSELSTDTIAEKVAAAISAQAGGAAFTVQRSGSALYIKRTDGANFSVTVSDGLADAGMSLVFGSIGSTIDLPPTGVVDGFTVRVVGDPKVAGDDFWLTWEGGVWREAVRPGSLTALDPATMPHALVLGGAIHDGFIVGPPPPAPTAQTGLEAVVRWATYPRPITETAGIIVLHDQEAAVSAPIIPQGAGSIGSITVKFDIDATLLPPWLQATVKLQKVRGIGVDELDSQTFGAVYAQGQTLTFGGLYPGDSIRVQLLIESNGGDVDPDYGSLPEFPATLFVGKAKYGTTNTSIVSFSPDFLYPESAVVNVAADAASGSLTVPADGLTGAQIAATLAGSMGGTLGDPGQIIFANLSPTPPTVSASLTFDSATHLWLKGAALTPSSLTGLVLWDVTTGARGTISSNSDALIQFGALSGGSSATLREGDVIRVVAAGDEFAFSPVSWDARQSGDSASNSDPSFVGRPISNVGITQNRLVFLHGEYAVASAAGKLSQFFRSTVQQVIDSDPIDVRGTASTGLPFSHMVEWNGKLNLMNGHDIYSLEGEPLTPRTVGLGHVYSIGSDETCRPVVVGRRLYIARAKNGYTQLLGLELMAYGEGVDSIDTTADVPEYLLGNPVALAGDAEGPLVIITEKADQRYVYVMQPVSLGRQAVFAWAQWTLPPGAFPLSATLDGGDLVLAVRYADGVYLESLDTLAHLV